MKGYLLSVNDQEIQIEDTIYSLPGKQKYKNGSVKDSIFAVTVPDNSWESARMVWRKYLEIL